MITVHVTYTDETTLIPQDWLPGRLESLTSKSGFSSFLRIVRPARPITTFNSISTTIPPPFEREGRN